MVNQFETPEEELLRGLANFLQQQNAQREAFGSDQEFAPVPFAPRRLFVPPEDFAPVPFAPRQVAGEPRLTTAQRLQGFTPPPFAPPTASEQEQRGRLQDFGAFGGAPQRQQQIRGLEAQQDLQRGGAFGGTPQVQAGRQQAAVNAATRRARETGAVGQAFDFQPGAETQRQLGEVPFPDEAAIVALLGRDLTSSDRQTIAQFRAGQIPQNEILERFGGIEELRRSGTATSRTGAIGLLRGERRGPLSPLLEGIVEPLAPDIPIIGQFTSPLDLASLLVPPLAGGRIASAVGRAGAPRAARLLGGLAEPIVQPRALPGIAGRIPGSQFAAPLAAELGVAGAAGAGAEEGGLVGGLAAGLGAALVPSVAPGIARGVVRVGTRAAVTAGEVAAAAPRLLRDEAGNISISGPFGRREAAETVTARNDSIRALTEVLDAEDAVLAREFSPNLPDPTVQRLLDEKLTAVRIADEPLSPASIKTAIADTLQDLDNAARTLLRDQSGTLDLVSVREFLQQVRDVTLRVARPVAQRVRNLPRDILRPDPNRVRRQLLIDAGRLDPVQDTIGRLEATLKAARRARATTEQLREPVRRGQAAQLAARPGGGEAGAVTRRQTLAGELPIAPLETPGGPLREQFTQSDVDALFDAIDVAPRLRQFERVNASEGLTKLLNNQLAQPNEIRKLQTVFGPAFAKEVRAFGLSKKRRAFEAALDVGGIPRALKSSVDLSAPLRQGALFVTRREWWQGLAPMVRALADERFAVEMDDLLLGGPLTQSAARRGETSASEALGRVQLREAAGLSLTSLDGPLSALEESFLSNLADRLPIVGPVIRGSQRAYVTFLNKLRADMFDRFSEKLIRQGVQGDDLTNELSAFARWINIASGRASLPENVARSEALQAANQIFFAPRFRISRLQALAAIPETIAGRTVTGRSIPRQARLQMARDLLGFTGTVTTMLTMMDLFGWIDVELDPRSSDFAKGKAGALRYDPFAGLQQDIRTAAQVITEQRKSAGSGVISRQDRISTLLRRGRGLLNPGAPALLVDAATGETFLGDELTPEEEARGAFLPLFLDDLVEAAEEEGKVGFAKALPGALGVGVTSFRSPAEERLMFYEETNAFNKIPEDERRGATTTEEFLDTGSGAEQQLQNALTNTQRDQFATLEEENRFDSPVQQLRADTDAKVASLARTFEDQPERFRREVGDELQSQAKAISVLQESQELSFPEPDSQDRRDESAWFDLWRQASAQALETDEPVDEIFGELEAALTTGWDETRRAQLYENVYAVTDVNAPALLRSLQQTKSDLATTRFWDIREQAWEAMRSAVPALQTFESFGAYQEAQINQLTEIRRPGSSTEAIARERAKKDFEKLGTTKRFRETKNVLERNWIVANPQIAEQALKFGYLGTNAAELEAINILLRGAA